MIFILQIIFDDGSSYTVDFDDFNAASLYILSLDYEYYIWDLKFVPINAKGGAVCVF